MRSKLLQQQRGISDTGHSLTLLQDWEREETPSSCFSSKGEVSWLRMAWFRSSRTKTKSNWKGSLRCSWDRIWPKWRRQWMSEELDLTVHPPNGGTRSFTWRLRVSSMEILGPGLPWWSKWLRIHLPMQGTQVQSLVRELKSHMPRGN